MPTAQHALLKWLSAAVWYGGSGILIWKGSEWLLAAAADGNVAWPLAAGAAALLTGVLRGRTMFRRACAKNLRRIHGLERPRPWLFFRPIFFLALAAMFLAGYLLSLLAETGYPGMVITGGLDLAIGTSLLMGSGPFWTWTSEAAPDAS